MFHIKQILKLQTKKLAIFYSQWRFYCIFVRVPVMHLHFNNTYLIDTLDERNFVIMERSTV